MNHDQISVNRKQYSGNVMQQWGKICHDATSAAKARQGQMMVQVKRRMAQVVNGQKCCEKMDSNEQRPVIWCASVELTVSRGFNTYHAFLHD